MGGVEEGGGEHRLVANGVNALGRLRLRCAPLGIPDLVATGVNLKGLRVRDARREILYRHLILRDGRLTGVAHFPVSGTTPESRPAVIRQTAIIELASDEEMKIFGFYWCLPGVGSR